MEEKRKKDNKKGAKQFWPTKWASLNRDLDVCMCACSVRKASRMGDPLYCSSRVQHGSHLKGPVAWTACDNMWLALLAWCDWLGANEAQSSMNERLQKPAVWNVHAPCTLWLKHNLSDLKLVCRTCDGSREYRKRPLFNCLLLLLWTIYSCRFGFSAMKQCKQLVHRQMAYFYCL